MGEKSIFADNNKATEKSLSQPVTLPSQGTLNFGAVTLGLPSEKALPKET